MKKTIELDSWSGKELSIEIDLEKDVMFINGVEVERVKELKEEGDPYVFAKARQ